MKLTTDLIKKIIKEEMVRLTEHAKARKMAAEAGVLDWSSMTFIHKPALAEAWEALQSTSLRNSVKVVPKLNDFNGAFAIYVEPSALEKAEQLILKSTALDKSAWESYRAD
jgi:hypothetical protein